MVGEPEGRPAQDDCFGVPFGGPAQRGLALQRLAEEVVTAKPRPVGIQGDDEQALGVQPIKHSGGSAAFQGGVAETAREPVQGRGADEQFVLLDGERRQHLRREVIEQVPIVFMITNARAGSSRRTRSATQGQAGQLETGRPAFGAVPGPRGSGVLEVGPGEGGEHGIGLGPVEPQIVGSDLGQLAADPESSDR